MCQKKVFLDEKAQKFDRLWRLSVAYNDANSVNREKYFW